MPERQWSMFVCPECESLGSSPGVCMNLSHGAHEGERPGLVAIEVVPHSELERAIETRENANSVRVRVEVENQRLLADGETKWATFKRLDGELKGAYAEIERLRDALEIIFEITGNAHAVAPITDAWCAARDALTPPAESDSASQ